jgi:hypothetical protein
MATEVGNDMQLLTQQKNEFQNATPGADDA